ncbi:L,D-transpeptidase catalytic domain [Tritonibacter multivorans]|uniref:L,D-transpeptidase catalytic domain n=1 Tax=Tritonibacter multivorans TaxID=928856 RepID=A0A0N7LZY6_9RHOB|nr:L,D-transpeptidase [Tritonibacter multivorans]MDA7421342.1 L,D-transpeptidase [Tritonibacter multivorans]CUH78969.1 L,D-transpeptidase catalytic domain [Tritonibacter multivorans]SFD26913.1 L,D-transpeptidase catalytic domain [Tritonibacter multivorans]
MRRFVIRATLGVALALAIWAALWHWGSPPPRPSVDLTGITRFERLVVEKSARRLTAFHAGEPVLVLDVALGFAPTGDKEQQGDGKTPEGIFQIDRRNKRSAFYLSLGLDYPRPDDRARAAALGVDPGGDIFIHGQPNTLGSLVTLPGDWTAGCVAVTNAEMDLLWSRVPLGTEVEIRP